MTDVLALHLHDGATLYEATPKQEQFHRATTPYVLGGGASRGGKSFCLRWHFILAGLEVPGFQALILRRTFTELKTTHLAAASVLAQRFPELFNYTDKLLKIGDQGSALHFGHAHNEEDVGQYLSTLWDGIGIDEAQTFTPFQIQMLGSRLGPSEFTRQTFPNFTRQLRMGANPGGIAHSWLKQRFVDQRVLDGSAYDAALYTFIPFGIDDNPYATQQEKDELERLPEPLRSMYRYGRWDLPMGALFEYLEVGKHLVPSRERDRRYRRMVGADWGMANEATALWVEVDQGIAAPAQAHVYREVCVTQMPPVRWAQMVVEESKPEADAEQAGIEAVYLDAAAFDPQQNGGPSPAEQMLDVFRAAGIRLIPTVKGPDSIRHGIHLLHTWFDTYQGTVAPLLTVSEACPKLWEALTSIQRGDAAKGQADIPAPDQHPFVDRVDGIRGLLLSRPKPAAVGLQERIAMDAKYTALAVDPLSQYALWKKRQESVKKTGEPLFPVKQTRHPWQRRNR